jgi:hypothetical protein
MDDKRLLLALMGAAVTKATRVLDASARPRARVGDV